jgi:hypothetical protein
VVHLHSTFSGVIGRCVCVLLKPWRRPKIVYCPHAFSFLMESSPIKQKVYASIERVLQKVTDVIICVSRYEMDKAARFGIERKRMRLITTASRTRMTHRGPTTPRRFICCSSVASTTRKASTYCSKPSPRYSAAI